MRLRFKIDVWGEVWEVRKVECKIVEYIFGITFRFPELYPLVFAEVNFFKANVIVDVSSMVDYFDHVNEFAP